ncbi:PAS domain S-box protein [Massilia agilis]|uniref:PAS domain S-box protein n=1 Tax=Massilia agilis TaxID=1811226 RepID=A0ABT2D7X8_9BURK|nr:PAS domain S-box protein [Massilia agilis]
MTPDRPPAGLASHPVAHWRRLCGAVALALGALVLALAAFAADWAAANARAFADVGIGTAAGFALCGAALLLDGRSRSRRAAVRIAGGLTLALALVTLLQPLHGLYADSLPAQLLANADPRDLSPGLWPGRMRSGAAFALGLAGTALLLLPNLRGQAVLLAQLCGAVVAATALPSLLSNLLGNVLLAGGRGGLQVPVPTALGMAAVGCGLCLAAPRPGWLAALKGREDRRIFFTSFALFALLSVVASMVGVGIVGRSAMNNFQEAWLTSFRSNASLFQFSLEAAATQGSGALQSLRLPVANQALAGALEQELRRLGGRAGLALIARDGSPLARAGSSHYRDQFSVTLPLPQAPRLYWSDGWRLLFEVPQGQDRLLRLDLELAAFNARFAGMNGSATSGEMRVCAMRDGRIACFPSRLQPDTVTLPLVRGDARLPIQLALEGQTGVGIRHDYRGAEVLAAYGTIPLGLGLVQKVDTEEFFRPLRRQLLAALAGMAFLILGGASLLQWRTQPLVRGLVRTRARLDAILDNVPAGVLTFDAAGRVLSANRAACRMFGYAADELAGVSIGRLLGARALPAARSEGRVQQLTGYRRDGGELALEVLSNEFRLGERRRHIAIVQDVGERVRMEQALRQREASLAHAQQMARIGSWERDLVTGRSWWSDETFRIFGLAPGGEPPDREATLALLHPDDRSAKVQAERDAIARLRSYDVTFRAMPASGQVRVIHSRAEVEFDAAGKALRLRGTIQDITEKTWADEQLRKREEEYRALVENSPDVVIRFDRELRCVYVNPALAAAPGLHPVIGLGRVLGDGDKRASVPWVAAARRVLGGGRPDTFEVAVDGGGALCHYQVQVVPEFRQGGVVAAVLATARDISAIRSGEAVLRESEQRLAGIAANTPGAVFQCVWSGGELTFTYVSEGVAQLFGETPGAVLADPRRLTGHFTDAERPGFYASLARSARSLNMLNWEGRAHTGDGRRIWVNCRATPRMAGAATVWEGLMLNITDSKRNEQQLTESRQLLRELSAHRELVREEERKKVAREVHDELGQALTALRMDVALLRMADGPHSEALLARFAAMKEAVDRTIGIVRNVTSALRPAALDLGLNAALEWQVDEFARRSGIECVLHADEADVELDDGQATALFRIVQESLTNVLKHAGASYVEVHLEASDDSIALAVRDNGQGFAAEAAPQRGKFGLMGMRERVLMLGGTVEINSAQGVGTSIEVRLPRNNLGAPALLNEERCDG